MSEIALWRAVLDQALSDASVPHKRTFAAKESDKARSWFGSANFDWVCDLAGLDGDAVFEYAAGVVAGGGRRRRHRRVG